MRTTRQVRAGLSLQAALKKQTKNVTAAVEITVMSNSTVMDSSAQARAFART